MRRQPQPAFVKGCSSIYIKWVKIGFKHIFRVPRGLSHTIYFGKVRLGNISIICY